MFLVYSKVAIVSIKVSRELTYKTNNDMSQNYPKSIMLTHTPMNLGTNFPTKIAG